MNRLSRNFRQDAAMSFHMLSSTPGATALLITGNKGNFLHIWLPLTFLAGGRGVKGRKTCEPTLFIFAYFIFTPWSRKAQIHTTFLMTRTS